MSYDFPEGYVPPPKPRFTVRRWVIDRYLDFVLWCALDAKSERLNRWGLSKLGTPRKPS